ncbi:hypothetical protein PIIN_09315 [Serendipita indica DSM 11827]|uniref:ABC transmembrane type-1 domain-containing protein n=1 Tax=Serendipita indica (strain DSM 11827) TaxID=1109443 RepID=G4TVI7_SERID|nr:hypothetical protein PIIN_09315 [Serendipita indica DSM 11827]
MALRCTSSLATVTLSSLPIVILLSHIGDVVSIPLQEAERACGSKVSNVIERAIKAIVTTKLFNAQNLEIYRVNFGLDSALSASKRLSKWWAGILGFTQFLNLSTIVQRLWFGTKQVTAESMVSLIRLVDQTAPKPGPTTSPQSTDPEKHVTSLGVSASSQLALQTQFFPSSFPGAFKFTKVTFHYPSRPYRA